MRLVLFVLPLLHIICGESHVVNAWTGPAGDNNLNNTYKTSNFHAAGKHSRECFRQILKVIMDCGTKAAAITQISVLKTLISYLLLGKHKNMLPKENKADVINLNKNDLKSMNNA